MFHNNIVKILEEMNQRNLLKICFQITGEKWKYLIFNSHWLE